MRPGDGGIAWLVENLAPVCRAETKLAQVAAQLAGIARGVLDRLERFHVPDDAGARLEARRAAASEAVQAIDVAFSLNRFGEVLEGLMVDAGRIADALNRVPTDVVIVHDGEIQAVPPAGPAAASGQASAAGGGRVLPGSPRGGGGTGSAGGPASAQAGGRVLPGGVAPARPAPAMAETAGAGHGPAARVRKLSRPQFQAETAIRVWLDAMRDFAEGNDLAAGFGISPRMAADIVGALSDAARRLELQRVLEVDLSRWNFALRSDVAHAPIATVAAARINGFVARLGYDRLPMRERPVAELADGSSRPVFQPEPLRHSAADLPETPVPAASDFNTDWIFALYRLYEDNARDTGSGQVDAAQNARIGGLLDRLRAAAG
jgi:hypothetical protein